MILALIIAIIVLVLAAAVLSDEENPYDEFYEPRQRDRR